MLRLFAALQLPPEAVRTLSMLRGGLSGARFIEPEDYHITLTFAGEVDHRTAAAFDEALARIERAPFVLGIAGLGAFGGRKPGSVHALVSPSPALAALQADTDRAARRAGVAPEARRFVPHVTLAWLRGTSPDAVASWMTLRGGVRAGPFEVAGFVLMSSREGGGGPYVVESRHRLRAPAPARLPT